MHRVLTLGGTFTVLLGLRDRLPNYTRQIQIRSHAWRYSLGQNPNRASLVNKTSYRLAKKAMASASLLIIALSNLMRSLRGITRDGPQFMYP